MKRKQKSTAYILALLDRNSGHSRDRLHPKFLHGFPTLLLTAALLRLAVTNDTILTCTISRTLVTDL